jgi:hypothetical protein
MTMPDGDGPASFRGVEIMTPGDWQELDLDPATRHKSICRAVRRAVRRSPRLRRDTVPLIAMLDRIAREAADAGALYCTSLVVETTDGGHFVANLLIQVCLETATAPVPLPSADERCAGIVAATIDDAGWTSAEVSVVALPLVGPGVRICVVDGAVSVQYLVPMPHAAHDIVLTFTCPCPPYATTAIELFDAMASSVVLRYD